MRRPIALLEDLRHHIGGQPTRPAPELRQAHPDTVIAELAASQHNVVARWQLLRRGLTPRAIERRLESGHLHQILRGVYAVGTPSLSQEGRWMAAALAAGEGAALSHRSAAALWGLAAVSSAPIEVVAQRATARRRRGLVVHRSTCLTPADLTTRRGIPVTSVERTLVDYATKASQRETTEAFFKDEARRNLDRTILLHCLSRAKARRGSGLLRKLLDEHRLPLTEANPGLERQFVRFCASRNLPIPEVNAPLGDFTVDCLWRAQRLVVELDSWEFHRDHDSFESDRRRDAWLQANGGSGAAPTPRSLTIRATRD